jgi:ABC transporter ATM
LIADEATSALDTATEVGIITSLKELAAGRTSIFVAHRLSTVRGCDRIVVLSAGRVAEVGSHAELMATGGLYRRMWEMQAEEEARAEDGKVDTAGDDDDEGSGVDAATALTPMPVLSPRVLGG